MIEKIDSYNKELNEMVPVKELLFKKQNASVFDKLCIKLNNLLQRFSDNINTSEAKKNPLTKDKALSFLRSLRGFAFDMGWYRHYLVSVVNENNNVKQDVISDNSNVVSPFDNLNNNIIPLTNNSEKTLQLQNNDVKGNAA